MSSQSESLSISYFLDDFVQSGRTAFSTRFRSIQWIVRYTSSILEPNMISIDRNGKAWFLKTQGFYMKIKQIPLKRGWKTKVGTENAFRFRISEFPSNRGCFHIKSNSAQASFRLTEVLLKRGFTVIKWMSKSTYVAYRPHVYEQTKTGQFKSTGLPRH